MVRKEEDMPDNMTFDDGMVCTPDDPSPFGTDETGIWELPNEGGIGPGPDDTSIIEVPDLTWPEGPQPSVEVDPDSEPTVTDPEPRSFPDEPTEPYIDENPTDIWIDEETLTGEWTPGVEGGETAVEGAEAGEAAVEGIEAGEIAVEAAEGVELLDVLEVGALLLL
jgi:hypothetical protein